MAEQNIQIKHNNGKSWDDLFPRTKATITILNDGRTVEVAIADLIDQLSSTITIQEVSAEIEKIVGTAPEALDTLKELADALGNNASFASTVTAQIGTKVDKVTGKQLSTNDFTAALKTKLDSLKDHTSAIATLTSGKVDKVTGKQLSTNDFTATLKTKLDSLKDHTSEIASLTSGKADKTTTYTKLEVDTRMSNLQENAIPVSQTEPSGASVWFKTL